MSKVLSAVGKVAGVVAQIAAVIPGGQLVAAAAAAVAVVATVGAAITAKKPEQQAQGSVTQITIGANQLSPYIIGETYCGGNRVAQVGYGTEDKVPNAHAWIVDVYSVGGPLNALTGIYADFTAVSFSGGNASGYYHNNLYSDYQLGATNEPTALSPHWASPPDWGSSYKLSGKAAISYNARFPKDGKVFASGFPQTGATWQGQLGYDPRADSTYPGGSGSQRWAEPSAADDFHDAKATWVYSNNPGVQALRYALGVWERDEDDADATYQKVFGIGARFDQVFVEDFVELANVADANGWTVNGVIFEPGDKWANLKRILAAGGAEPAFRGGRLGLKINAPKIALDTITRDDIAEGDVVVPGTQGYRERKNTLIPKYNSSINKWESVASNPVQVTEYVTEDGEVKQEDWAFDLVTGGSEAATQAAQLTAYELVNRREQGPITIPLKPRMRLYRTGQKLAIDADLAAEYGIRETGLIVTGRTHDPDTMSWSFTFVTDTADKHTFALSETGTSPPATSIHPMSDAEALAGTEASLIIRGSYIKLSTDLLTGATVSGVGQITIADHAWDYPNRTDDVDRTGAVITGLSPGTRYYVYFDDETLLDPTPTYHAVTTIGAALNSTANPYRHYLDSVDLPAPGDPPVGGGGGGGGYGGAGCPGVDEPITMADGSTKRAGDIEVGDEVWSRHEVTGVWAAYAVSAVETFECDEMYEGEVGGKSLRASGSHLLWRNNGWRMFKQLAAPAAAGPAVKITIADAHTYVVGGLLSHNKVVDPGA